MDGEEARDWLTRDLTGVRPWSLTVDNDNDRLYYIDYLGGLDAGFIGTYLRRNIGDMFKGRETEEETERERERERERNCYI